MRNLIYFVPSATHSVNLSVDHLPLLLNIGGKTSLNIPAFLVHGFLDIRSVSQEKTLIPIQGYFHIIDQCNTKQY